MPYLRIKEAADLLGVSDDTIRRWADHGRLPIHRENGRMVIAGVDLARLAVELADDPVETGVRASARNQLHGIVTRVVKDTVMAQVEMQAGRFRVVSLMSSEAVDELGLEPGVVAIASIKATHVVIELSPLTAQES